MIKGKHLQRQRTDIIWGNCNDEFMYHGHPFDALCTFSRNSSASGPITSATIICRAQLNLFILCRHQCKPFVIHLDVYLSRFLLQVY